MKSASLAVGVLTFFAVGLQADTVSFDYANFSSTTGLTLLSDNQTTTTSGSDLQLSPGNVSGGEAGMAYYDTALTLEPGDFFTTTFQFVLSNPGYDGAGNGIAFVLSANTPTLGGTGAGLGYGYVSNTGNVNLDSLAVAFNTNDTGGDGSSNNFVSIDTNGTLTNTDAAHAYGISSCTSGTGCMSNGDTWTATITYNGTLTVTLQDGSSAPYEVIDDSSINIASILGNSTTAYFALSAGTGLGTEQQDILNWQASTVPEPASWMLFGLGLILGAWRARRPLH